MENEQSLRKMWDTIKCNNTCVMGVPEVREKRAGKKFKEKNG